MKNHPPWTRDKLLGSVKMCLHRHGHSQNEQGMARSVIQQLYLYSLIPTKK